MTVVETKFRKHGADWLVEFTWAQADEPIPMPEVGKEYQVRKRTGLVSQVRVTEIVSKRSVGDQVIVLTKFKSAGPFTGYTPKPRAKTSPRPTRDEADPLIAVLWALAEDLSRPGTSIRSVGERLKEALSAMFEVEE